MRATILTIFIISTLNICLSQNDTIYLNGNFIELNGKKYNILENGIKSGKWFEYSLDNNIVIMRMASGENAHWHDQIRTEYRPLEEDEYNGLEIQISKKTDTVNGEVIYSGTYQKIEYKIPPDKYFIVAKGNYNKNSKNGEWTYLHENGKLKKEIYYKNGLPEKGYIIFRPEGTKMIEVNKVSNGYWEIIKYDESGKRISSETKNIDEFKMIY